MCALLLLLLLLFLFLNTQAHYYKHNGYVVVYFIYYRKRCSPREFGPGLDDRLRPEFCGLGLKGLVSAVFETDQ